MKNDNYLTFEKYVEEIRCAFRRCLEWWAYDQRVIELVTNHGGPDFQDFRGTEYGCARPEYPEIPSAPDTTRIKPYSRVTLAAKTGDDRYLFHCPTMLVVSIIGDSVEGFVFDRTVGPVKRESVDLDQVITCEVPLKSGESESGESYEYNDLPF